MRILKMMLDDMASAEKLYKPTNFWQSGLERIVRDLEEQGFENFREHQSAQVFYAPVYAHRHWRKRRRLATALVWILGLLRRRSGQALRRRLVGIDSAFQDYRVFRASDSQGGIDLDVGESDVGGGERFEFDGKRYSRSFLNYLRGMEFLKRHVLTQDVSSILEIGGGYGSLGEILLKAREDGFYVNVDIPPVAAVSTYYLQQVFGEDAVLDYSRSRDMEELDLDELRTRYRAVVLCSWQLPRVKGMVDVFANFISFQEMEPHVMTNYVKLVQPLTEKHVLLRNSVKGKKVARKMNEMGVLEPTTTDRMVEAFNEFELLGRDSVAFGEASLDSTFRSEVLCLSRIKG